MSADKLSSFLGKVIALTANVPGTGVSSAGLMEARSPQQHLLEDTKRHALAMAGEYRKASADKAALKDLSEQLEGSLQGLRSFSIIDDNQLDSLVSDLEELRK